MVTDKRLCLFGQVARSLPDEDQPHSITAAVQKPLPKWKRPIGRPSHTWLCAIEVDLMPLNIGLSSAWKKATIRENWRSVVDTEMLKKSMPQEHISDLE